MIRTPITLQPEHPTGETPGWKLGATAARDGRRYTGLADWKPALEQVAATLRARQFAGKYRIGEMLKILKGIQVAAFWLKCL
jgi:hypothetical protein